MGFLRRLIGGRGDQPAVADDRSAPVDQAEVDAEERAHELELARFEQDRTVELVRRQQRYAPYAWTPPAQGGEQRAGEGEAGEGEGS